MFWNGKKVLITGHTGFKGSWLSLMLKKLKSEVYGYSLDPPTVPNMYSELQLSRHIVSYHGDIRDGENLGRVVKEIEPDIIFHLAAQAIVSESYRNPVETYSTNVMGTVNLLQACRDVPSLKVLINVTSDKCYENKEWVWGYRENETLGGFDPYSSSKACSELITSAYVNSFFNIEDYENHGIAIATARAGNVIGGGDRALDRLIPDFIRSIQKNEDSIIRSPNSIRPWQHVMEPLSGYIALAEKLFQFGPDYSGAWNFGPKEGGEISVQSMAKFLCEFWDTDITYKITDKNRLHETNYLKIDSSKARQQLNWDSQWGIPESLKSIVEWNKAWLNQENMKLVTDGQIQSYFEKLNRR